LDIKQEIKTMADNRTPRDEKQKSYYSLNLTEGRRFVIFIVFIIFFAVLLVGVIIVVKNIQNTNSNRNQTENTDQGYKPPYYSSQNDQNTISSISISDSSDDIKKSMTSILQTKIDTTEDKTVKTEETPTSNIDNSETLYSSKFSNASENTKSEPKISSQTKITAKKNVNATKQTKNSDIQTAKKTSADKTNPTKKYVVQIGSYTNKKTAEDIASFYKSNGNYPTYIKDIISDGKTFYRLRVGPFSEKTRAEMYLTNLKVTKYGKNSYISEVFNL
jgi:cell division septation protein DedD